MNTYPQVQVIEDSVSPEGVRLTTLALVYPRYIHSELMTHRVFSRNASSSRAIPVARLVKNAKENMVFPCEWGKNQRGMQADSEELTGFQLWRAKTVWKIMARVNMWGCNQLQKAGLHKQWANRPLEWFTPITVLVTATEWDNFFELRCHPDAQPEIRNLACAIKEARDESTPLLLDYGQWHLPYVTEEEKEKYGKEIQVKISIARCARVSYNTHDGKPSELKQDIKLYDRLVGSTPIHASPTEHQATPQPNKNFMRNLRGWMQYRVMLENPSHHY